MKYPIIAVTLSLLFSTAWAGGVDCEKTPYYGACPNCEPSISDDDSTPGQLITSPTASTVEKPHHIDGVASRDSNARRPDDYGHKHWAEAR